MRLHRSRNLWGWSNRLLWIAFAANFLALEHKKHSNPRDSWYVVAVITCWLADIDCIYCSSWKGREAIDRADEMIRGSSFDDIIHKIKVSFGAEDPTVQERIMEALSPKTNLIDKVKNVFGRDTGIYRGQLYDRLKQSLSGYDPRKQESYLQKVCTATPHASSWHCMTLLCG